LSVAFGRSANGFTLWAVLLLTHVLRAAHTALWLFTVNFARCTRRLLALHLTLRALTHRMALSGTNWVIALPSAFRMALSGESNAEQGEQENTH